jgi:arylsulfatase
LFWEHENNAAVCDVIWKAVRPEQNAKWQLFKLTADRTESINLAAEYPEPLAALTKSWEDWARRVAADPFSGKPKRSNR